MRNLCSFRVECRLSKLKPVQCMTCWKDNSAGWQKKTILYFRILCEGYFIICTDVISFWRFRCTYFFLSLVNCCNTWMYYIIWGTRAEREGRGKQNKREGGGKGRNMEEGTRTEEEKGTKRKKEQSTTLIGGFFESGDRARQDMPWRGKHQGYCVVLFLSFLCLDRLAKEALNFLNPPSAKHSLILLLYDIHTAILASLLLLLVPCASCTLHPHMYDLLYITAFFFFTNDIQQDNVHCLWRDRRLCGGINAGSQGLHGRYKRGSPP